MISPSTSESPGAGRSPAGFGFLGMLLLIILISLSVAAVLITITPSESNRRLSETVSRAGVLRAALTEYKLSHGGIAGTFPADLGLLISGDPLTCVADNNPANANTYRTLQGWCGPYVNLKFVENADEFKFDGWGTPFSYAAATGTLTSCGANRICGDGDDQTFNP